ncbi:MAG TPA: tripartite tricarboxylate transporter substrate binding protein [Burkholderiales bacterium]|nr:tripartite tricarboxylate transporter substrate binding protein [Burkholderiales bacterium]
MSPVSLALFVFAAALVVPVAGGAESYPTRPVRVIAPYPPGSSADVMGRIYSRSLTEAFGQPFVVDNRSGASGNIAAELVANAAPDGHTLLVLNTSVAGNHLLQKSVPFDVERDFQVTGMLGIAPYLLVVNNSLAAKSVKDLIAMAKANAGKLVYASTGVGGGLHLTMELFRMQTGINMLHVPYKGSSATVPDMIGGRIDVMFGSAPSLLVHVRAGRIRALGITSVKRSVAAPDVPTVDESGVPGFESGTFGAFAAPAKTPRSIVGILNTAIAKSAQSQEVAGALAIQGTDTAIMTPEQSAAYIRKQIAKWKKVVETAGIRAE